MEIYFKRKKEFMAFFQRLPEQKDSFYTKEQLVKLKTYEVLLFDWIFGEVCYGSIKNIIRLKKNKNQIESEKTRFISIQVGSRAIFRSYLSTIRLYLLSTVYYQLSNKNNCDFSGDDLT